ncbi:hypothetical protein ACWF82_22780 [Nocardia sp. NPDC055053]
MALVSTVTASGQAVSRAVVELPGAGGKFLLPIVGPLLTRQTHFLPAQAPTVQGLSTCIVSHVVELASSRAMVADLVGHPHPQVLVRIGAARTPPPPRTPRRPIDSFLEIDTSRLDTEGRQEDR